MSKTLDEKSNEICEKLNLPLHVGIAFCVIKRALRDQDRDTRHACAEAVLMCKEDVSGECIWKNDAHSACMNVKTV